jgi:hypothetical protein
MAKAIAVSVYLTDFRTSGRAPAISLAIVEYSPYFIAHTSPQSP